MCKNLLCDSIWKLSDKMLLSPLDMNHFNNKIKSFFFFFPGVARLMSGMCRKTWNRRNQLESLGCLTF